MSQILLDTGPLVAYALADEQHHIWSLEQFRSLSDPLLTCEPVLAEAAYLLSERGGASDFIWAFLRSGGLRIVFDLETEFESVAVLMKRYAEVPMDLADACLVRMSELQRDCKILTLDSDFKVYRRFGRQIIPLICPN
ncbi:MAG: PIN domain-containing protein [Verrucomicrobiota bacterium]